MEELKSDVVEIIEPIEVPEPKEEISLEGLDPKEKQLAEKQGLVKKEEVKEEIKPEAKKEPELQTFEDTEKNEKELIKNYNKNEQALYFKWKNDKRERQAAKKEYELAVIREKSVKNELERIRESENISTEKLKRINNLLTGTPENITVEAIQEILSSNTGLNAKEDKKRPVTVEDLENIQKRNKEQEQEEQEKKKFVHQRVSEAENFVKANFDNYEDIIDNAKEVLEGKVQVPAIINIADLSAKLAEAIQNKDIEFETIAEYVHGIAKLNPNFGKSKEVSQSSTKKETNENIDRILKNASKQQTSAAVSGSNGRRLVSYEDLTLEDAAKLSQDAYNKLPDQVRKRLRKEASL